MKNRLPSAICNRTLVVVVVFFAALLVAVFTARRSSEVLTPPIITREYSERSDPVEGHSPQRASASDDTASTKLDQLRSSQLDWYRRVFQDHPDQWIPELDLLTTEQLFSVIDTFASQGGNSGERLLAMLRTAAKQRMSEHFSHTLQALTSVEGKFPKTVKEIADRLATDNSLGQEFSDQVVPRYELLVKPGSSVVGVDPAAPIVVEKRGHLHPHDTFHSAGLLTTTTYYDRPPQ